jgi:hypothetical protein
MTTMSAPPRIRVTTAVEAVEATETAVAPTLLRHIHDLTRDEGLIVGLRALTVELAPCGVPFGSGGHAVLPTDAVTARPGRRLLTVSIGTDAVHAVKAAVFEPAPTAWLVGISWLRLGASRWLLRQGTEHVTDRTVGTERLIQQQMIKGMIAEALTEQLEAESLLDGRTDPAVLIDANARIQLADRMLLRLLGASGFQAGLPSHTCWVSELLADAYIGYEIPGGTS